MSRYVTYRIWFIGLLSIISTACSVTDDPDNIQPGIITLDACDITRTEAVIGAEIHNRGKGKLSFIRFRYGRDKNMESTTSDLPFEKSKVEVKINGLIAGETYYYCAEGGKDNALIRSEIKSFKTEPNRIPSVSNGTVLSSGPVGAIVGFEIREDGGSALLSAGCIVTDKSNGETRIVLCKDENPHEGQQIVNIVNLATDRGYIFTPFATNSIGENHGERIEFTTEDAVVLKNPGDLEALFGCGNIDLETLKIAGGLNGDDFRFIRQILKAPLLSGQTEIKSFVRNVDLTNADVVEGGNTYDGRHYTENNILTSGLFSDCTQLQTIRLPESAKALLRDAFSNSAIRTLRISSGISKVEPSSGCRNLEKIEVSEANKDFCCVNGVLMNITKTSILWIPMANKGVFDVPAGVETIGMNVFRGSGFSSILLPSTLKNIGSGAFSDAMIGSIVIPDLVEMIPEGLFQQSVHLETITLGKSVNYISDYAFDGCGVKKMILKAEVPPYVDKYAFTSRSGNLTDQCVLCVPETSLGIYRNHSQWGRFKIILSL